ncbi:MAG: cation diffusion facilitator family transporter, partial [Hyphomicrobiaceae bacterium]
IAMGVMRLMAPIDLPTGPMLIAAAGGLVTEVISIYLLYEQQGRDLNVRGAFWHVLQTFAGSLIIIVAALVIRFTGFLAIDPILGTAFGFVLLWASWEIMRDSMHVLMEGTPTGIDMEEVSKDLLKIAGVIDVHHLHAWALTTNRNIISAHIRIADDEAKRSAAILEQCHQLLRETYDFYFSTLQVETECLDEEMSHAINVEPMRMRPPGSKSPNE